MNNWYCILLSALFYMPKITRYRVDAWSDFLYFLVAGGLWLPRRRLFKSLLGSVKING